MKPILTKFLHMLLIVVLLFFFNMFKSCWAEGCLKTFYVLLTLAGCVPESVKLTSSQVGVVALWPARLVLQSLKRSEAVLEVQLYHAAPTWPTDRQRDRTRWLLWADAHGGSELTWREQTYQSHRDTHAGSLFGLMQALMHHGNRPKHCWYDTGDRGESTRIHR